MAATPEPGPIGAPAPITDQRVRDRIRDDLDATLVIEAAAGTGKTTALVNRIVAVIASGRTTLDRIVALTFTEKAAGELKLRLRAEIERARHDDQSAAAARARLNHSLSQLEQARIGTIHSFCADLLRERPVEARVDPLFEVAAEDLTGALFETAFDRWFEAVLAAPGEGVRRILRRRELFGRDGPRPVLRAAAAALLEWRDFDAPWQPRAFERDRAIDELIEEIHRLGTLAEDGAADDWLGKALTEIARPLSEATRLESVRGRDYEGLEGELLALLRGPDGRWRWRGAGENFGEWSRAEVLAQRAALRQRLERFRDDAGANLAPQLREELWPLAALYTDLKNRAGRLDFLDLLLVARDLVHDNRAVRAELQARFTHIFVDEFQDTDPLQAEILLLLAAGDPSETDWTMVTPEAGKLFLVGDPKQSIYRFRRADVSLYQSVKRRLLERGAQFERLTTSFRATPEIQSMVNAAFAPLMQVESETQPLYAPLEPFRPPLPGQPAVIALPVPAPYSELSGRITKRQIDESLPDAVAGLVKWLVEESGWKVTERESPTVPAALRPRHICILFRRLNAYGRDVTRGYVRALEARHVPHVLVKGGSFNEREEVEAIRNALGAVERPDDELLVFATLRGPIFALTDGALLEFRETIGSLHPFRTPPADLPAHLAEVAAALAVIRALHRGRNRRPIADTMARLLGATRAHAGFAIWPTGEQALANVMRLMDQARRYESAGGSVSLRGFVDQLEARAEREEAGEVPVVEEGTEGVRIMTVHRAKGLEFAVVILADITCNETAREPQRYADPLSRLCALRLAGCAPRELLEHADDELRRDSEEAVRVLYVAATRARDLIVIPTIGDQRHDGWVGKLAPALYPDPKTQRTPLQRQPQGCPAEFGLDSVRIRPPKAPGRNKSVAPGTHKPECGNHQVVWWDPAVLALDVRETMGLRQSRLLEADESGKAANGGKEAYAQWHRRREEILSRGAAPTIRVTTATELAAAKMPALPEADRIVVEQVSRAPDRPRGQRFGTLVHAALARIAFDSDRSAILKAAAFHGRILGGSDAETAAAAVAVAAAIESPLMRRAAAAAAQCRRECSLLLRTADGVLVEGVADLAFLEDEDAAPQWVVVDYKTDFELAERIDEYRTQLALYVRAIAEATGRPARGILLWL